MNFFKIFFILIFTLSINILGEKNYDLEVLVDGLDHPWSLVELSSGEFLLTELPGNLKFLILALSTNNVFNFFFSSIYAEYEK